MLSPTAITMKISLNYGNFYEKSQEPGKDFAPGSWLLISLGLGLLYLACKERSHFPLFDRNDYIIGGAVSESDVVGFVV